MLQTIFIFIISIILFVAWLFGFAAVVAYDGNKPKANKDDKITETADIAEDIQKQQNISNIKTLKFFFIYTINESCVTFA